MLFKYSSSIHSIRTLKNQTLVSGRPVDNAICDSLLGLEKDGIGLMESFEERLTTEPTTVTFFSPLKRNKYKSWKDSAKKIVIKKDG